MTFPAEMGIVGIPLAGVVEVNLAVDSVVEAYCHYCKNYSDYSALESAESSGVSIHCLPLQAPKQFAC